MPQNIKKTETSNRRGGWVALIAIGILLAIVYVLSLYDGASSVGSGIATPTVTTVTDKLELLEYQTGFYYEYGRYSPIVILKWKNTSTEPLHERVEIEGIFIDTVENEEISRDSEHLQWSHQTPMQPGLSKQLYLQCNVVYRYFPGADVNISCQIFVNGTPYKTVKIEHKHLDSNRIQ